MNTNQITITSNTVNVRLVVLFVLLLLSSLGMSAQNTKEVSTAITMTTTVASNDDTATTTATAVEANTNMNFVSWFMGTKQTPRTNMTSGDAYNKKQLINSGIAPNRLLIKAFLKKAANYQSTVA
jgi:hypothetical protein